MKVENWDGVKGYRASTLKKNLSKEEYESLNKFMRGQTVGLMDNGEIFVYEWDYDR